MTLTATTGVPSSLMLKLANSNASFPAAEPRLIACTLTTSNPGEVPALSRPTILTARTGSVKPILAKSKAVVILS